MASPQPTIVIVGGGIAGLCTGIYARMNGYRARIFEQHTLPGGLCTAWQRKGYTMDLCIHWLVGSRPGNSMYELWREVGLVPGPEFIDVDEFGRMETTSGETVVFFRDLDRTEQHLLEFGPADEEIIKKILGDARRLCGRDFRTDLPPAEIASRYQSLRSAAPLVPLLPLFRRWGKITMEDVGARFTSPALREAFAKWWHPQMSAITLIMTLAWLHERNAGYPIGGSVPLARAIEQRFLDLGGEIEYGARVAEIVVERDRAVGVEFDDGRRERGDWVVSAADGHETLFDLLSGRYLDEVRERYYRELPRFPSLVFIGIGVNRAFTDTPKVVSGWSLPLDPPLSVGGVSSDRLGLRIMNFDPTLAPPGKTVITVALDADYAYWSGLAADALAHAGSRYEEEKAELAATVLERLEQRIPGFESQVEVVDVATPVTLERYTSNWMGSYEGWLPTPQTFGLDMPRRLPGLDGFVMAGQWVMPGGGLPSGALTGRQALQIICKSDTRDFRATTD